MYDDFNPVDENDYDIETTSLVSFKKSDVKEIDSGYHRIKRSRRNIEFYATPHRPKSIIRNAVSGGYEIGYLVGSSSEDIFFSVILATGETGQTPSTLFYDSPQQYELHFGCKLPLEIKNKWTNKYNAEMQRRRKT